MRIAASILAADFTRLGEAVRAAERGGADLIHVDVMDGHFVPPITIGAVVVESLHRMTTLPLDVHLMVEAPERHVEAFLDAGAARVGVHVEAATHLQGVLTLVRSRGAEAVAVLNPATPPEELQWVLPDLDGVLVMSVNPGYAGQDFIPATLPKIRRLREMLETSEWPIPIGVDGGINATTAGPVAAAGARILIAASAVFRSEEPVEAALTRIREAAAAALRVQAR